MSELSRIEQRVYLKAKPERVWRALTDRKEFASWWGSDVNEAFAAGKTVEMSHAGEKYQVDIIEMSAPRKLVWRWHPGARDKTIDYSKEPKTTVSFDLVPFDNGTLLTVRETGFEAAQLTRRPRAFTDNVNGWLGQAAALGKFLGRA